MGMLAKIRRMHFREKLSIREITRSTNLSRNTIRQWLRQPDTVEPQYPVRPIKSVVEPHFEQIRQWLKADSHRAKKERRTAKALSIASVTMVQKPPIPLAMHMPFHLITTLGALEESVRLYTNSQECGESRNEKQT